METAMIEMLHGDNIVAELPAHGLCSATLFICHSKLLAKGVDYCNALWILGLLAHVES